MDAVPGGFVSYCSVPARKKVPLFMMPCSDEQRRGAVLGMRRTRGMNSKFLVCADPRARVLVAEASLWGAANILLGRPHTSIADAELQQAHCGLMCGQTDIEGGTALKTSHEAT